jgi:cell division protein FtsB
MRFIRRYGVLLVLILVLMALQAQFWFSHGGVEKVTALKKVLSLKQEAVNEAQARNHRLIEEVKRIQNSHEAIETHARYDLGMVKPDEEYVQIISSKQGLSSETQS